MYESFSDFLRSFSTDYPILWALLVMAVIAGTGLVLFGFWELVIRWMVRLPGLRNKSTGSGQG